MAFNLPDGWIVPNDEKVKCLVFYINPSWDHRPHKVYLALPEGWDSIEDKDEFIQKWFEEWLNSQVEDSGWTFSRAYEDELTII